ncbi:MAG: hypothetical protein ACKOAS_10530, partial [Verrucomicrobiota bacterium]
MPEKTIRLVQTSFLPGCSSGTDGIVGPQLPRLKSKNLQRLAFNPAPGWPIAQNTTIRGTDSAGGDAVSPGG